MGIGYRSRLKKDLEVHRKKFGYKPMDKTKLPNKKSILRLKDKIMKHLNTNNTELKKEGENDKNK